MMKIRASMALLVVFAMIMASGTVLALGPELEVETDREVYPVGRDVVVTAINVGDEVLIGGGPMWYFYDSSEELVFFMGFRCMVVLEPSESGDCASYRWDQKDQDGNQVPNGKYRVVGSIGEYSDDDTFWIGPRTDEVVLEADMNMYDPKELVTFTLTNNGDATLAFPAVPFNYVIEDGTGEVVKMVSMMQVDCLTVLEPGESTQFFWDQTYYLWDTETFGLFPPTGEQVPDGAYVVSIYGWDIWGEFEIRDRDGREHGILRDAPLYYEPGGWALEGNPIGDGWVNTADQGLKILGQITFVECSSCLVCTLTQEIWSLDADAVALVKTPVDGPFRGIYEGTATRQSDGLTLDLRIAVDLHELHGSIYSDGHDAWFDIYDGSTTPPTSFRTAYFDGEEP